MVSYGSRQGSKYLQSGHTRETGRIPNGSQNPAVFRAPVVEPFLRSVCLNTSGALNSGSLSEDHQLPHLLATQRRSPLRGPFQSCANWVSTIFPTFVSPGTRV